MLLHSKLLLVRLSPLLTDISPQRAGLSQQSAQLDKHKLAVLQNSLTLT